MHGLTFCNLIITSLQQYKVIKGSAVSFINNSKLLSQSSEYYQTPTPRFITTIPAVQNRGKTAAGL